jgi:hypothetical protein
MCFVISVKYVILGQITGRYFNNFLVIISKQYQSAHNVAMVITISLVRSTDLLPVAYVCPQIMDNQFE